MAQTTGAGSGANFVVEVSPDGTTWTDISGSASSVEPGEQTRQSGEAYTGDGDTAIITSGKREPLEPKVNLVYTNGVADGFEVVRALFEAGSVIYVRYGPFGDAVGKPRFTCDPGPITSLTYPPVDAEEAKPVMAGFSFKTAKIAKSVVAA